MNSTHNEAGWAYAVIFDDLRSCGCGIFEARLDFLKDTLNEFPLYESNWPHRGTALGEWFLCLLDGADLIEHGSSIGGSWLTGKGARLLAVLNDEEKYKALLSDSVGYCECAECRKSDPPS